MVSKRRLSAELLSSLSTYFSNEDLVATFLIILVLDFWIRFINVPWANSSSFKLAYFSSCESTFAEVLDEIVGGKADVVFVTLAGLEFGEEGQPVGRREVD